MKTKILLLALTVLMSGNLVAQKTVKVKYPAKKVKSKDWKVLLDNDLTAWEVWTGVPHKSIKNLPEGYQKEANGENKKPVGLGDPFDLFTVSTDEDGEPVLNISGLAYGGLTSIESYSNYHLTLLFKWGEKKYEPRLNKPRDCGLLYHCHGEHGAFWDVWKSCLESQIQERDFGDLFTLAGTSAKVRANDEKRWDPTSDNFVKSAKRSFDAESPHGEWTRVDLYVIGDKAVHVTNGVVVLALTDAKSKNGNPLTKGQIQIQSEGAECYAKDICIRPINKFPKKVLKAAGW
ncbi:3-keto-disaccharide hydrolase [Saccharicrinis sp. 156]|uniref:3-keto-disaccharide hydrolase n=1 Tax=Saccharicrinis sp. 156 TaxID=3417574 RepID=UPI003D337AEF